MNTDDLARMTPNDREHVEEFISLLQAMQGGPPFDPARMQQWIAADPERRIRWLGLEKKP